MSNRKPETVDLLLYLVRLSTGGTGGRRCAFLPQSEEGRRVQMSQRKVVVLLEVSAIVSVGWAVSGVARETREWGGHCCLGLYGPVCAGRNG